MPEPDPEPPAPPPPAIEGPAPDVALDSPPAAETNSDDDSVAVPTAEDAQPPDDLPAVIQPVPTRSESEWVRTLRNTNKGRLIALVTLLGLAVVTLGAKQPPLMAFTLSATVVWLGLIDGGFLSITHVTSAIWSGASAFTSDLVLLTFVVFTIASTFLVGRLFCGFLCPFGAIQDFLTWVTPKKWQRRVRPGVHRSGLWVKYVVMAGILIPAALGIRVSLYQYVEPFGTVFYRSGSLLLWGIAIAFLAASVIIPRFYCRYVCPLGAVLAIGSILSLKRISRVRQCDHCKVCENACPTGAIDGPQIDFKECVRCNDCEIKLREQSGVCRHDADVVAARLVQLGGRR